MQYNLTDPAARAVAARRTDILVRLRNVGNVSIPLDRMVLRYWLASPGADVLTATCLNATTGTVGLVRTHRDDSYHAGCGSVVASAQPGVESLAPARLVLTAVLAPEAGSLSPGGVLRLAANTSNEVWEVLLRVQAQQLPLDASKDYSFLDTRPAGQGGLVVGRYVEPNPRITATLDGRTLWGAPPTAVRAYHGVCRLWLLH